MEKRSTIPTLSPHGAAVLPSVSIDCYNVELRDADGFVGDRANKAAFRAIITPYGSSNFGVTPAPRSSGETRSTASCACSIS